VEFSIKSGAPENLAADCMAIGVFAGVKPRLTSAGKALDQAVNGAIQAILDKGDFSGKTGSCQFLYNLPGMKCERVLLFGLGKESEATTGFTRAIRAAVKAIAATRVEEALIALDADSDAPDKIRLATLAAADELTRKNWTEQKEKNDVLKKLAFWRVAGAKRDAGAEEKALREGEAIAAGMKAARTLGDMPANQCTPGYLADAAEKLAKRHKLHCEILDEKAIRAAGMNALLAVAQGSRQPPRFIVLEYKPRSGKKSAAKPLALIGKGITFDSGGISLKPPANMDEMKFDMCGAASVIGVMEAVARLRLPLHLVALIPACENMPGGDATRPGDVIATLSGQTVEILNTDAEGRLILCDALTYAKRFDPIAIIDVATLTGACAIALGRVAHGLFANDDALSAALLKAGEMIDDRAWRLPLWNDYQEALDSQFADMSNSGGREGGAITGACFLSRFVDKKTPWAHLDIAGTAWKTGKEKGATGRPVAMLCQYLLNLADGKTAGRG